MPSCSQRRAAALGITHEIRIVRARSVSAEAYRIEPSSSRLAGSFAMVHGERSTM